MNRLEPIQFVRGLPLMKGIHKSTRGSHEKDYHHEMFSAYENYIRKLINHFYDFLGQLWVYLAIFEITLRDFFDFQMRTFYKRTDWWMIEGLLRREEKISLSRWTGSQDKGAKKTSPVTRVSMSFWIALTSKKYQKRVWAPIKSANNLDKLGRNQFQKALISIREVRNKVAHHQDIPTVELMPTLIKILELISILAPSKEKEMRHRYDDLMVLHSKALIN